MEKDFFDLDEYQLYNGSNSLDDNDLVIDDNLRIYCREVSNYPLLKEEEEANYLKMLANPDDKKLLLIIKGKTDYKKRLNIELLFYSLCCRDDYETIVQNLIEFYGKLNSHNENTVELLQKYLKETRKVNRALTRDEVYNIFHFERICHVLHDDLLIELKKFKDYIFAFDKMFVSNLRLVVYIAKKYFLNAPLMDLISEGNIGLMNAIINYDIYYGTKFSGYAFKAIYSYIKRCNMSYQSIVRLPTHFAEKLFTFKKRVNELEIEAGRHLTIEEISTRLEMPLDIVRRFYSFRKEDVYLNQTISGNDKKEIKDIIPAQGTIEDEVLDHEVTYDEIDKLFNVLRDREKLVLKMFYGLGEYEGKKMSIINIADAMNVSRQFVNNIKVRAMKKLYDAYNGSEQLNDLMSRVR